MSPSPAPDPTPAKQPDVDDEHGAGFWIGLAIGGVVMAYGVRGVFMELGPRIDRGKIRARRKPTTTTIGANSRS